MITNTGAMALVVLKDATTTLLLVAWNAFKALLTVVLLLLAWFAALGAWLKGAFGVTAAGVTIFLLVLACAPWVIPKLPMFTRRS